MTEEEKQVGKDRLVAAALEFTHAERRVRQTQIELEQSRTNPDVRVWLELTENYHAAVARMSRAERALHAYADAIESLGGVQEDAGLQAKYERLRYGVVANAGRHSSDPAPRWSHVADATGLGSTSAASLCREAGFDPDVTVSTEAWEEGP